MSSHGSDLQFDLISPCQQDWDSMIGNNQIRFCQHCRLSVHNLENLNSKQLHRLLVRSGRLCVRFSPSANRSQLRPSLYGIRRRASVIAAGAVSASLTVSTALASKIDPISAEGSVTAVVTGRTSALVSATGAKIQGYVLDPAGAIIVGALVTLTHSESGDAKARVTDGQGEYRFDGLTHGTYHLKIAARGFATNDVPNIVVRESVEIRVDQTLSIAQIEAKVDILSLNNTFTIMGGAVAVSTPTEPLVAAANADDIAEVQQILLRTPNANVRDESTQLTALECAVRNANREMIQLLLSGKADVNARDRDGQTVMMLLGDSITEEIVWDLLSAGAKVNARDNDGDTPLIAAAETNNVMLVKALLDAGANVNARNNEGRTALMVAAQEGFVNHVRLLLLAGAELDARDKQGKTALIYARRNDHQATIRLLKSFGAAEFEESGEP